MNIHQNEIPFDVAAPATVSSEDTPITSARIMSLAKRAIEGAPALTVGEMRELADAILDHNARSAAQD